jgi:hypothetical protein
MEAGAAILAQLALVNNGKPLTDSGAQAAVERYLRDAVNLGAEGVSSSR